MSDLLAELKARQESWFTEAACLGLDSSAFFPRSGESPMAAKIICNGCSVREECLSHALEHHERHGIWGGLTQRERTRVARMRRRRSAS